MEKFYLGFINGHVIFDSASTSHQETEKLLNQNVIQLLPNTHKLASLTIKEFSPVDFRKKYGVDSKGLFE